MDYQYFPTSFNQEGRLALEEVSTYSGTRPLSHSPCAMRIVGAMDPSALEWALNMVVLRHEALRTTCIVNERYSARERRLHLGLFSRLGVLQPGLYCQAVARECHVPLQRLEIGPGVNQWQALEAWAQEFWTGLQQQPREQPVRAILVQLTIDEWLLIVVMPHLIFDGFSVDVLFRELSSLYVMRLAGHARRLPTPTAQQSDFTRWQHHDMRVGAFADDIAYWMAQWRLLPSVLVKHSELPIARTSANPDGGRVVNIHRATLSPPDSARIRALATQLRCTPYVIFRAVVAIVLYHWTHRRTLAFWANFANRRHAALARTIAWCANTHAVSVELAPSLPFTHVCSNMQTALRRCQQHEAVPLPAIWAIKPAMAHCDTRINVDVAVMQEWRDLEWSFSRTPVPGGRQWIDLDVRLYDHREQFTLLLSYNVRRYDSASIETLGDLLQGLFWILLERPELSVQSCHAPVVAMT